MLQGGLGTRLSLAMRAWSTLMKILDNYLILCILNCNILFVVYHMVTVAAFVYKFVGKVQGL